MTIEKRTVKSEVWIYGGKEYKTLAEAEKTKAKAELPAQRKYAQENATGFHHLVDIIIEKAKEFWNVDLKLESVSQVRHLTNYTVTRVTGVMVVTYDKDIGGSTLRQKFLSPSASGPGFIGVDVDESRKVNDNTYAFYLKIDVNKFPLMVEKLPRVIEADAKMKEWEYIVYKKIRSEGRVLASSHLEELNRIRTYYAECLEKIDSFISQFTNHSIQSYVDKWIEANPAPVYPDSILQDFGPLG